MLIVCLVAQVLWVIILIGKHVLIPALTRQVCNKKDIQIGEAVCTWTPIHIYSEGTAGSTHIHPCIHLLVLFLWRMQTSYKLFGDFCKGRFHVLGYDICPDLEVTGARTLGHVGTWPGGRMAARGLSQHSQWQAGEIQRTGPCGPQWSWVAFLVAKGSACGTQGNLRRSKGCVWNWPKSSFRHKLSRFLMLRVKYQDYFSR